MMNKDERRKREKRGRKEGDEKDGINWRGSRNPPLLIQEYIEQYTEYSDDKKKDARRKEKSGINERKIPFKC